MVEPDLQSWGAVLVVVAGLFGVTGVGAAAMAAHGSGGSLLTTAATFLMIHAAALLALSLAGTGRLALTAATVLALGLVLFAGDLASAALRGSSLFPGAAPAGGLGLMAGWALVAITGLVQLSSKRPETRHGS